MGSSGNRNTGKLGDEEIRSRLEHRASRSLLHLLDYLIVLRPMLFLPGWTLVLLGYYQGALQFPARVEAGVSHLSIFSQFPVGILLRLSPKLLGTICLYSMLMGGCYIINQIVDRETDEANNKLYLVAQGYVKLPVLILEVAFLFAVAVIWAVIQFHDTFIYLLLIALSVFLGVIYSVPPFRLKGKPFLDLCANAIGYGVIAFLIGWVIAAPIGIAALQRTTPYAFYVGAAFLNTTLPDLKGDMAHGDRTTGALFGVHRACQMSLILLACAIVSAWFLNDWIALMTGLFCLPFFIYMNFTQREAAIILATRVGILALSLLASIVIPYYFILLVATLFFVRWYYAVRFAMKYPF